MYLKCTNSLAMLLMLLVCLCSTTNYFVKSWSIYYPMFCTYTVQLFAMKYIWVVSNKIYIINMISWSSILILLIIIMHKNSINNNPKPPVFQSHSPLLHNLARIKCITSDKHNHLCYLKYLWVLRYTQINKSK